MSILIRVGMAFIVSAIFLPLAFLGITHGSSFGLESGISLIILNIIAVIHISKLKDGNIDE